MVAELEESNVQLTEMLNNELGGTTFMGEPLVAQSSLKASQGSPNLPLGEPVAWMHESPERVDVIHTKVKELLQSAGHFHRPLDKSEKYTIPLYTSAPTIPDGWKLVPIELVQEMRREWWYRQGMPSEEGWKAMLAAAPEYKGEE